jgi:flagellar P-ring protein precursor FlgI
MNRNFSMIFRGLADLRGIVCVFFLLLCLLGGTFPAMAARLKDMAEVQGMRANQISGYGLVVGLNGTGDGTQAEFTIKSIANMLERMGVNVDPKNLKTKNVAGVMVTAQLPPFAKIGQKVDVVVSSMGDAKSLQGGTLLLAPLKGVDGKIYALAQGPISIGGFAAGGAGASTQKNHPTAGRIPAGASVEREVGFPINEKNEVVMSLFHPDFTTVQRAVDAINKKMGEIARAKDAETIAITVPPSYQNNVVGLMAAIENVELSPDQKARVILDERTGTVVMGADVRISKVAIAHGNLSIQIKENPQVSQPQPFSQGATAVTPQTSVNVTEQGAKLLVLDANSNIGELVRALNAIGVTPRDMIAILQSLRAAGAIQADVEVI